VEEQEYRERLSRDLAKWRAEGLIDEAQERAILARYGAGEPVVARALRMGWLVSVVSILGAVVFAGGVVLFFAANWQEIPDPVRTAIVFAGIALAYVIGYLLMFRFDMQRLGSAFLLLGVLLYQAGLFLLAQIYNMPVDSPVLFLLGALGALPLAYLFGSRIILLLAIAAAVTWQVMTAVQRHHEGPDAWSAVAIVAGFGFVLYAAGRLHALRSTLERLGEVYVLAGALIVLGITYLMSFHALWRQLIDEDIDPAAAPADVYGMFVVAAFLIGAQAVWRPRQVQDVADIAIQAALLSLALIALTWPSWMGYVVLFNLAYFLLAVALIARGYTDNDERYVNFGLAVFALGIVTRYIDVGGEFLVESAFLLVGGLVLLVLAFILERVRREILRSMSDDREEPRPAPSPEEATP
jgi:uncharacterized membrane protein